MSNDMITERKNRGPVDILVHQTTKPLIITRRPLLALLAIFVLHAIIVHVYIIHHYILMHLSNTEENQDIRLLHSKANKPKILVVYAGPSNKSAQKVELYTKNLEFFLRNGIDCDDTDGTQQDTVIVVGHEFYNEYLPWIQQLNDVCKQSSRTSTTIHSSKVIIISRRDVCYDMEAARLALYGGVNGINVTSYDYFIFVNCGTSGPGGRGGGKLSVLSSDEEKNSFSLSWTSHFISLLDDQVKMTGLTLNCEQPNNVHIQVSIKEVRGMERRVFVSYIHAKHYVPNLHLYPRYVLPTSFVSQ